MKLSAAKTRRLLLGSLLFATIAAAVLVEDAPDAADAKGLLPERRAARSGGQPASPPAAAPLALPERVVASSAENDDDDHATPDSDPFRPRSWYVAPPPPPPPKPKAPPLPFQYLGQLLEDGETRIFVNHQGRHLVIKAGDLIGSTYRVEEIAPGRVLFTFLPLKESQVLATGTL